MPEDGIKNAKLKNVRLGFEDHGIFTSMIDAEFGGGSFQGLPNYQFGSKFTMNDMGETSGFGLEVIMHIMRVVGVEEFGDLEGKPCRIIHTNGMISGIGNLLTDEWFHFQKFSDSYHENVNSL